MHKSDTFRKILSVNTSLYLTIIFKLKMFLFFLLVTVFSPVGIPILDISLKKYDKDGVEEDVHASSDEKNNPP